MEKKHIMRPYPDSLWNAAFFAIILGFLALLAETMVLRTLLLVVVACVIFQGAKQYLTCVEFDENGICIRYWKYTAIPESPWEEFCQACILDVSWSQTYRFHSNRFCAYYLLLTTRTLRLGDVRELGMKLSGAHPCGRWKGHVALRLPEDQVALVRQCICEKIPLIEKHVERDEAVRL